MRLTYKTDCGHYTGMPNSIDVRDALQKLATLEDVEEELGIDLITLFKALNGDGIWLKLYGDKEPKHYNKILLKGIDKPAETWHLSIGIDLITCFQMLSLKDYGKTWALTKEELL